MKSVNPSGQNYPSSLPLKQLMILIQDSRSTLSFIQTSRTILNPFHWFCRSKVLLWTHSCQACTFQNPSSFLPSSCLYYLPQCENTCQTKATVHPNNCS